MANDQTQLPKYTVTRRSYIPREPGKPSEILDADTEIVFEGKPGSNLLPVNVAAIRMTGGKIGDAPDAERLVEMQAERDAIWRRLEAAQTERNRLLADDHKSPELKRLRREIEDLAATHREHGESIEMLKVRAIGQIDDMTHAANLAKRERAVHIAKNRAAILNGPALSALRALADALVTAGNHTSAIRELARAGLDFDQTMDLVSAIGGQDQQAANWAVSALVQLGGLPGHYLPLSPGPHGAEALAALLSHSFAPEHPAAYRDRTRLQREHAAVGESYEENIARGRALDAAQAARAPAVNAKKEAA